MQKTNIVILASGPPKPGRNRHLEKHDGEILIDRNIRACSFAEINLYVLVHKDNYKLIEHLTGKGVEILYSQNETLISTLEKSLSVPGDCILVSGDLKNLRKGEVKKFINSEFASCICKYENPWGANLISSTGKVRRSDIGDCIFKISQEHKVEFLSKENKQRAEEYFSDFYPNRRIDYNIYNDMGTHMTYSFFHKISSSPGLDTFDNIGAVLVGGKIYEDND